MALVLKDRVRETSTTSGTGTIVLAGAVSGFQSFSAIGNTNTTYYCIADSTTGGWEVGIGTYTSSGTTLSRTTVLASSNSGALVAFSANVKDVFCTYPASQSANINAALTSGRVTYATTDGLLTDSAGLTFDGTNFATTGTATAAKLIPTGTSVTGNGMYLPATNSVGISTAGTQRIHIDASGNVGIGTSSPAAKFHVSQTNTSIGSLFNGTTKGIRFGFDTTGSIIEGVDSTGVTSFQPLTVGGSDVRFTTSGTERMRLDSSGNVGIGTSSPANKLEVSSANNIIYSTGTAGYGSFYARGSGTNNSYIFMGNATSGEQGRITVENGGAIVFGNTASATERMRIDSSGNVAIGTASPVALGAGRTSLTLNGSTDSILWMYANSGAAGYLQGTTTDINLVGASNKNVTVTSQGTGIVSFNTNSAVRMQVDASGNMIVGTGATIDAHLEVYGAGTTSTSYTNGDATGATLYLRDSGNASGNGGQILFGSGFGIHTGIKGLVVNGTGPAGDLIFQTRSTSGNVTEKARVDYLGNLLVGVTADTGTPTTGVTIRNTSTIGNLGIGHPTGAASGNAYATFAYNGGAIGSITQSGTTAVLYNVTSDQRLKENIVDAPEFGDVIDSIQVRSYDWKTDHTHQRAGFVAQELVTVAPEAVHQPADQNDMMAVDYSKLVPMLVKEIQSLRKRLTALEGKA